MTRLSMTLAAMLLGSSALAGGDALVIGNARYSTLDTMFGAARVDASAQSLRDAGLDVTESTDADARAMRQAFAQFVDGIEEDDAPIIVVLAGVFMHATGGAYLLPVQRKTASAAEVMTQGLPLDAVFAVLARHPGRALLVLGESPTEEGLPPYLDTGPGRLDIPQGVTVLRGPVADVARFAATDLVSPGRRLTSAARRWELRAEGFAPDALVILRRTDVSAPEQPAQNSAAALARADNAAWAAAQKTDTRDAYQAYLSSHANGAHAPAARQRLAALDSDPFYRERKTEDDLDLSRDMRRKLQRDLTLLGYNTRGIDGIFGRGTRSAVQAWQKRNGFGQSGYFDAGQINRLDDQAKAKARELEDQARKEQEAQERRDRLAWDRVTGPNDEAALREYLTTYPDGLFADRAQELLGAIENRRAARAAERDRRAWARAEDTGTQDAYRRYLSENPQGAFRQEADARLRQLTGAQDQERAQAKARQQEEALNLNPVARRLAEARLDKLGLKPGKVDGRFDAETRRAIRRYQKARGLPITGYLNQDTVVRLLADGIFGR